MIQYTLSASINNAGGSSQALQPASKFEALICLRFGFSFLSKKKKRKDVKSGSCHKSELRHRMNQALRYKSEACVEIMSPLHGKKSLCCESENADHPIGLICLLSNSLFCVVWNWSNVCACLWPRGKSLEMWLRKRILPSSGGGVHSSYTTTEVFRAATPSGVQLNTWSLQRKHTPPILPCMFPPQSITVLCVSTHMNSGNYSTFSSCEGEEMIWVLILK